MRIVEAERSGGATVVTVLERRWYWPFSYRTRQYCVRNPHLALDKLKALYAFRCIRERQLAEVLEEEPRKREWPERRPLRSVG